MLEETESPKVIGMVMNEHSDSPDLFSLTLAPLSARVAALGQAWERKEASGNLPGRALQIAGLVVEEAVRLIRLGSPAELSDAALEVARFMARPEAEIANAAHLESYRLVSGASVVLGVASAPSSGGAELAMLRSWNGKAREAVAMLNRAHGNALARSDLRSALGELTESHLSHLLADLEASGLAVRIREGKTVTVHLGPQGRSEHVQAQLGPRRFPSLKYKSPAQDFDPYIGHIYFPKSLYQPIGAAKEHGQRFNAVLKAADRPWGSRFEEDVQGDRIQEKKELAQSERTLIAAEE